MTLEKLCEGKSVRTPHLNEQNKLGLAVALSDPHSLVECLSETKCGVDHYSRYNCYNSIISFLNDETITFDEFIDLGIDESFSLKYPIAFEEETDIIEPSDVIIVEGSGIYSVLLKLDLMIIGTPETDIVQNLYISRCIKYKTEEFIKYNKREPNEKEKNLIIGMGWLKFKKLPKIMSMNSLIIPTFYSKFEIEHNNLNDIIDELIIQKKLFIIYDYLPKIDNIQEMLISKKYNNDVSNEFKNAHKIISKLFDKIRYPSRIGNKFMNLSDHLEKYNLFGKPMFRGGSHNIFIVGGLNRDLVAQTKRQPQDFDLIFFKEEEMPEEYFDILIDAFKSDKNIESVKIRSMRKSKSIHFVINNIDYEINLSHFKNENEMIESLLTKYQFTIDTFIRRLSEYGDEVIITDVSGMGEKDIEKRILRFSPSRNESTDPITAASNTLRALMMPIKMVNLSKFENNQIKDIFQYDINVKNQIEEVISNNFYDIPQWKANHFLNKELPYELSLIENDNIRQFFEEYIDSNSVFKQLRDYITYSKSDIL